MNKYFLGLDIGTDSVGYAVSDENYNIIKKGKKQLIGSRLFESGQTAEQRRIFRSNRRRLSRKKDRITYLRALFNDEISKIDPYFFMRLDESMYHVQHKTVNDSNSLFNDLGFKDKDYHKKYKTIYHLRKALISGEVDDVRLLYLGIEHIIKHRGHFLFEGQDFSSIKDFGNAFSSLNNHLEREQMENLMLDVTNIEELENIVKNKTQTQTKLVKSFVDLLPEKPTKEQNAVIKLMLGGKVGLKDLFGEDLDEELQKTKICFKENFEESFLEISTKLDDKAIIIELIKSIYDWSVLTDILDCPSCGNDKMTLSDAKIYKYETHKEDLKTLKEMVRKYIPSEYKEIFENANTPDNYAAYIGSTKVNGKKQALDKNICQQEEFCKYISKKFEGIEITETKHLEILDKASKLLLLPKLRVKDNGVIPYQVHKDELDLILKNNSSKFAFLNVVSDEYTVSQKIGMIFKYRIPYYVGPLNQHSKYGWIVRNSNEKITPWNFSDVVNIEQSAEAFIENLTNKCTYLRDKDVIPQKSLLYSEFMVLNELNNLKIDGQEISVELKQELYENVFKLNKKITKNKIKTYLIKKCYADKSCELTGIDVDFKASLESYMDFTRIFGENFDEKMAEDIIKWIVLFADDKKLLKNKILESYKNQISEERLKEILKLKYKGWGRLSKEFLCDLISDVQELQNLNIIQALYKTNMNLMQLLSKDYDFIKIINAQSKAKTEITIDDVRELYCSPAVKKSIWQTVQIVKEIEKIMGGKPEKLFIEVTRAEGEKKATVSRKNSLKAIYNKEFKKSHADLISELDKKTDADLRQKKLYLYFTQLGRCAYTNEIINLSDLNDNNKYDIEHIYPRSLTKDDSIHDNLVLVKRTANAEKTNQYPIPVTYRQPELWKTLHSKGLINKTKYDRLMRQTEFEPRELEGFINRQLVETSQSSKAVAELFVSYYQGTSSKVVYVKAGNVTDFRNHFKLLKVRDINDYHHAHDAYFNIVVGNIWDEKFTKRFFKNINSKNYSIKPEILYDKDIIIGDKAVWIKNNHLETVKDVYENGKILFTRHSFKATGKFFKETIHKKGNGEFAVKNPIDKDKIEYALTDISKDGYGSYKSIYGSHFCVVEHLQKKKTVRTIEYVPIYLASQINDKPEMLDVYLKEKLGLVEHRVILRELKIGSLLNVNGFPMHISARTGDRIIFRCAVQLKLDKNAISYFKKVTKFVARTKENPDLKIYESDKIDKNTNLFYYDLFIEKLHNSIYTKTLSAQYKTLSNNRDKFIALDIESQCKVLSNILILFKCDAREANLSLIGASSRVGTISILKIISNQKSVKLINQSITGFYENSIDLLK